jgi:RNA polymerase sigma factor (sigma-70 family)
MDDFSERLRRARVGEPGAIQALYDAHRDAVERTIRATLGPHLRPRFDVGDICQSIFGDMLRELAVVEDRGEDAFRSWLLAKARNKIRTKARRQTLRSGRRREERLSTDFGRVLASGVLDPHEAAAHVDDADRLCRLLGTLEPHDREILGLVVDEELSWGDCARRMGLPSADAARMRYVRALARLRELWTVR